MRPATIISTAAALALAAGVANAAEHTLTFTITNNTIDAWQEVIFEIRPPRAVQYDPADYAMVMFVLDLDRHETTKNPVDISVSMPERKALHFDFSNYSPMTSDDGPITFTVRIDNPSGMDFRVGYRKILVPAPGAAGLLIAGVGLAAFRRRRAA